MQMEKVIQSANQHNSQTPVTMFVSSTVSAPSFDKCRLLVPCISVGNVGQLTVDLLINTLQLPRVGYLDDPSLLPLVGNNAFDHMRQSGHLHVSGEVYHSDELKLTIVQLRTPTAKGFKNVFCSNLLSWVKQAGFSEMVVLTSSEAYERRDAQIRGEPFRFLLNSPSADLHLTFTDGLKWTSLEPRTTDSSSVLSDGNASRSQATLEEAQIFIPGSGLAKRLLTQGAVSDTRVILLIEFCSQGDNIQDAVSLASRLNQWIPLAKGEKESISWLFPSSWSLMYGGPSPENIF